MPSPDPPPPFALLAAARGGSRDALGELLESYRRYLYRVARDQLDPRLLPKGDQSDLVQETFREAQQAFNQFRGTSEEEFLVWIRQILLHRVNRFTRHYRGTQKRSSAREIVLDPNDSAAYPAHQPTPSTEAAANDQYEAVQEVLARLPNDYQAVIRMKYVDGMSFEDIGRAIGRSAEAARKVWMRAVERLRDEMGEADDGTR
jgi:RNA polymerase sigma-70 factor (ECF subfamily)